MITELVLFGAISCGVLSRDKIQIHYKWRQIMFSKNNFTNKLDKCLKIWSIKRTSYGHIIRVELPYSYTLELLEKDLSIFREGLHYSSIQLRAKNNIVDMFCVQDYKFNNFTGLKLPPNKLLIGDGLTEPLIIDMNKFPHLLVGGDTGTGKSRLLLVILANLIKWSSNVEIYLLQRRKNDLQVFKNCAQVKVNAKTLEEILETLEKINRECMRREILIDNYKGYYNLEDYNKVAYNRLNYIYIVIEEFSFLNTSRGDDKETKYLKNRCLGLIKELVNVGRGSGIFLLTALQKPTSDSIPSDIKGQLTTRVSPKIKDAAPAIVILGNDKATKLKMREFICSTLEDQGGYSYTIDHQMVMDSIKKRIISKVEVLRGTAWKEHNTEPPEGIRGLLNEINR